MIKNEVSKTINGLYNLRDTPYGKRVLAEIRQMAGRPGGSCLGEFNEAARYISGSEMYDFRYKDSNASQAISNTLVLYAVHQRGETENINSARDEDAFPRSAARLCTADADSFSRIGPRMKRINAADDIRGLVYEIMQMIKLVKRKGLRVNYGGLAKDIYEWLFEESRETVRERWSRQFFETFHAETDQGERA